MNGEWCIFQRRWSPAFCDSIIERSKKYPFDSATIGVAGTEVVESYRKSKIKFIYSNNYEFKDVFDDLWQMAISANHDFFNFHITKLDAFQLTEYDAVYSGEYKQHRDVFWMNNDPRYHRKLSCVVQLTNQLDYTDGNLELLELEGQYPDQEIVKPQGSATFFPAFTLHRVTPVTFGKRYSLVAWFDGPKWR